MSGQGPAARPGLGARLRRWMSPEAPATYDRRAEGAELRLVAIRPAADTFADLCERLGETDSGLELCAALPESGPEALRCGTVLPLPENGGRRAAEKWLGVHRPTAVLWMGAIGDDPLLDALVEGEIPALAADVPPLDPALSRSVGGRRAVRAALGHFSVTLAQSPEAVRSLRRVAQAGARIEALGPVTAMSRPPKSSLAERDELAQALRSRPAWLAVFPGEDELPAILAAHRQALRGAHRLLLIIAPAREADGSALAARLRGEGWRASRRGVEGEPDDTDEIFIADSPDEIGLWFRLAPITYLGGTLTGPAPADPFGPASLGSAIIAGPMSGGDASKAHDVMLARLASAGGLSRIDGPDGLAAAVADLLAPDRAALLAHAAWDVASDPARIQDRLVAEIRDLLRAPPR